MGRRESVAIWVESPRMQRFIVGLILLNAAVLGLETSQDAMERWGDWLKVLDRAILAVFVAEIGLKLYGRGWAFFRSGWNVFDFLVVGIGLLPASGPLSVLRALRLLRVLSMVPRLRFIVEALLRSIPGISSIALLMLILFYVAAVMATGFFGERFPDWFGTLGASMYTLFQVMTLESWSMGIARPVMAELPFAWVFFVPFILIATFTILNLFIAIIVNTMQNLYEREQEHEVAAIEEVVQRDHDQVADELRALRAEVAALREALATSGTATRVDRGRDPA